FASYSSCKEVNGRVRKLTKAEMVDPSLLKNGELICSAQNLRSQGGGDERNRTFELNGMQFDCGPNHHWKTPPRPGLERLSKCNRLQINGNTPNYLRFVIDNPVYPINDRWLDTAVAGFSGDTKRYVVETPTKVVERCILMTTDPGDLVFDPTCGSGTSAVS